MSIAPWRSPLESALHQNRSLAYARYLQLATVRPNGKPANRTLVFRGFLEDTDQLQIVTDARSEKAAQIDENSWGEACWYFPETRQQFRLAGHLTLVRAHSGDPQLQRARQVAWEKLSDPARLGFAWPTPGKVRAEAEAFELPPPDPVEPLPHFCLLLLEVDGVDLLQLRDEPQSRWIYERQSDGTWSVQAVNP